MLVNSFDTKYSITAKKYESLDNSFTKTVSSNKKFSRIFTSVIEDKSLKSLSDVTLRSDITGQVINTILTHDSKSKHFLYYIGDVLKKIIKKNYTYVFTDPKISHTKTYLLDSISHKNNISKFVNIFKKKIDAPFELNLEKDFFSQDYHQDIFFYVYSNSTKKILAQGGGYKYKKNTKKIEGFGFSCNVDYIAELI